MPPGKWSRFQFCQGLTDAEGRLLLSDRVPFRFVERVDNRFHTVTEGDTLYNLASQYFSGFDRPAGLYWVIADYQPDPIIDPTVTLTPGCVLVIPSSRLVREEIFNEARRDEFNG